MLQMRIQKIVRYLVGGSAIALVSATAPADAQQVTRPSAPAADQDSRPITVLERQAERERARGFDAGGVRVLPVAFVRADYDSNVFAGPDAAGDAIMTLGGLVLGELDTSRTTARFTAAASRQLYAKRTSENATQWGLGAEGTVSLPSDFSVRTNSRYDRRVEPRTSSGAPVGNGRPVRYSAVSSDMDLVWRGARLLASVGGRVAGYDYRDTLIGGVRASQQFRDFRYTELRGRVGYDIGGDRQLFGQIDRHWANYALPQAGTGADRDTRGWQATAGIASTITPLLRGTASLGYLREDFALRSARPVSALAFSAQIDWLFSPITTVHLDASRRLENSASLDSVGYLASHVGIRLDHEFTRRTLLDLTVSQDRANFRSIDRRDVVTTFGAGARHQLTDAVYARLRTVYQHRRSQGSAQGFNFGKLGLFIEAGHAF